MIPPPPSLATQESVDNLTKLVESLHVKIDKLFSASTVSSNATVPAPPPVTSNLTYASVVRALADSEKIKAKAQRAVLVGSVEKATPEETMKNDEQVLKSIIETTKDKELKEAYEAGSITHARFPPTNEPGRRIVKYILPSSKLRDRLLAGIRTIGRPAFFEPSMYIRRDLMPSELEQERSARMEARKSNIFADCLRWGVRDCELIEFKGPSYRPLPKEYRIAAKETNPIQSKHSNKSTSSTSSSSIIDKGKANSKTTVLATIKEEPVVSSISTANPNSNSNNVTTRKREEKTSTVAPSLSSSAGTGGTTVKDERASSHQ